MKNIFDEVSYSCSENVTKTYSTSFSLATRLLSRVVDFKRDKHVVQRKHNFAIVDEVDSGSMLYGCLLYTSPSPRDATLSRMPSSA